MRAGHWVFLLALVILIAGRFHWLFRSVSKQGNYPTPASFWLRIGSVIAFIVLCVISIVLLA